MTSRPALVVLPTADLPGAAAAFIADTLRGAVAERGVAHWATTGGSSAPAIYQALAGFAGTEQDVSWDRVHTWWGDDRYVPFDHPLSNVLPFDAVFGGLEAGQGASPPLVPLANRHPWPVPEALAGSLGPDWAAARYGESLLAAMPPAPDGSGLPVFDLVIVGVGPDGHILSVFPGSSAFDAVVPAVAVPAPTHIEPHVERVTLNPGVVRVARRVLVTTTGAGKAANLGRAWAGDADPREVPVAEALLPTATWLLDEAAAAEIPAG
jgi:6-phosphogluconolactonase